MQTRWQQVTEVPIEKTWCAYCHSEQSCCNPEVTKGNGARETREKTRKGMRGVGWEVHVTSRDPTLDAVGTRSCAIRRGMSKNVQGQYLTCPSELFQIRTVFPQFLVSSSLPSSKSLERSRLRSLGVAATPLQASPTRCLLLLSSECRAEFWKCFLHGSTVRDRNDFGSLSNATNEAGKNFAGSELQEQVTPELINHVFDSLRPPDSSGYLLGQALRDVGFSGYRLGRNISDYCRDRPEDSDAGEVPSQFFLCRNHQPRMERSGDV